MSDEKFEPYPELENDLSQLEITKLKDDNSKLVKQNDSYTSLYKEKCSDYNKLRRSYRKAGLITAAIVIPLLIAGLLFGYFAYENFGGGPEQRAITAQAEKQAEYDRSFPAQCEKAGGRVVGTERSGTSAATRYCVFENGATLPDGSS